MRKSLIDGISSGAGVLQCLNPRPLLSTGREGLFLAVWGMPRVEPHSDDLGDLPGGDIELAGDLGPDHRYLAILPAGREFDGTRVIGDGCRIKDIGHLVGGVDIEVELSIHAVSRWPMSLMRQ